MNIRTRKRGRPCSLTPEVQSVLLKAVERGLPLKESASLAGVSYDTLNRWRNSGEAEDAPPVFRNFYNALYQAQAVAVDTLVSQIQSAARKDWKAAAWLLERWSAPAN